MDPPIRKTRTIFLITNCDISNSDVIVPSTTQLGIRVVFHHTERGPEKIYGGSVTLILPFLWLSKVPKRLTALEFEEIEKSSLYSSKAWIP